VRSLVRTVSPGAVLFAATLPIVFLHVDYQPKVAGPLGATVKLSDAMILLTALAAAVAARKGGLRRLRAGRPVWIGAALFLVWIVAACFYPLLAARSYPWRTHLVTAGEFGEYALLAPAVPLLLRRPAEQLLALGTLVGWTVVASGVALVQWAGWSGLGGWGRGNRQPSFLGTHDLTALAGMTLGIGIMALLWRVEDRRLRRAAWVAVGTGVVGFVLGGATAGVVGLVPAALLAVAVARRRGLLGARGLLAVLAATAIAALGVVALRAADFDQFFRFLGAGSTQASATTHVQTYSQRTLLAYVGLRIWEHHNPLVGVGWEASGDPALFVRELPAAHARFPKVAPLAFPSAAHPYGVQILYVQVLADLGLVGAALLVALFAAALVTGIRHALRARPEAAYGATLGLFWLLLAAGLWSAVGLVAGLPLDAMTWLAFGFVSSSAEVDAR